MVRLQRYLCWVGRTLDRQNRVFDHLEHRILHGDQRLMVVSNRGTDPAQRGEPFLILRHLAHHGPVPAEQTDQIVSAALRRHSGIAHFTISLAAAIASSIIPMFALSAVESAMAISRCNPARNRSISSRM